MARPMTTSGSEVVGGCCGPIGSGALSASEANEAARIFSVLSDPARLRILSLIASQTEVCSCDLEGPTQRSQPTISHHTRILSEAGLITGEKRGRWTWWSVVPGRLKEVSGILSL
ncbi:MAG TPA: metalloregulator ArsR/SmtB family transcription factor [Acidimicrobiales bacterium]|jgi:ArsR family transcriptional regulator|nr:metalloregulator ArsR/SmtB family transcription factor [Acidimicrobiales bacterium]